MVPPDQVVRLEVRVRHSPDDVEVRRASVPADRETAVGALRGALVQLLVQSDADCARTARSELRIDDAQEQLGETRRTGRRTLSRQVADTALAEIAKREWAAGSRIELTVRLR